MDEYVFDRNMKFVGDFDGLYKHSPSPWGQDGKALRLRDYYLTSRVQLYHMLAHLKGPITEVGCGHGHALKTLSDLGINRPLTGLDISREAIRQARELHPDITFKVFDITRQRVSSHTVILNECLWYVLHALDAVFKNIKCRYLVVNQGFLEKQAYGRDVIDGWGGLISFLCSKKYTILEAHYNAQGVPLKNGAVLCEKRD